MSFQLMTWAIDQKTGNVTRKAVLLALANRANHDTGRCDPSISRIADETELSPTTVKKALRELAAAGMIEIVARKHEDGGQRTNAYRFPRFVSERGGGVSRPGGGSPDAQGGEASPDPEPGSSSNQEVEPTTALAYDPLVGVRVAGQDLPWNALAERTHAESVAYGPRMKRAISSIRKDVVEWLEVTSPGALKRAPMDPVGFEVAMAKTVERVADALIQGSDSTLTWGPEGIARNFRRGMSMLTGPSVAVSVDEIVEQARSAT